MGWFVVFYTHTRLGSASANPSPMLRGICNAGAGHRAALYEQRVLEEMASKISIP